MTHLLPTWKKSCAIAGALLFAGRVASAQDAPVAQPVTPLAPPPEPPSTSLVVISPAAAKFETAMTLYDSRQYVDAVTAFSGFLAAFPQDRHREEALYRLAESYRNLQRNDDALAAYAFQIQSYPEGPLRISAELRRGALWYDQQKFVEAIPPLRLVAEKGDGETQVAANYLLGRALLATQKEGEARAILQAIVNFQPPAKFSGDAAQTLAELDDAQGKFAEALPLWQTALALAHDPATKATAAARGGWSALQAKQPDVAEKLFLTTRKLNTDAESRKVANTGLLRLYFQRKQYSVWLKLHEDATNAKPPDLLDSAKAELLFDLGHAHFSLQHWPEAVTAFDAYLQAYGTQDAAVTAAYERLLADTQTDPTRAPVEGEAFLKSWPKSPYCAKVQLLQAQQYSREKKFAEAAPLWDHLSKDSDDFLPQATILLELARAHDELKQWPEAATAYQAFLDRTDAPQKQILPARARLAFCLQNANQLLAATDAWNALLSLAPVGSSQQEAALESLGLIYARGGPTQERPLVETFQKLLAHFPQTPLRALADFTVGDALFRRRDYAGAEPLLLDARKLDATAWRQPATQRLVLGAYGAKKYDAAIAYLKDYDALPPLSDPQAALAARLPAAFFYWLGETARQAGKLAEAENHYARVTRHPEPGDLLAGAWYQLGEVQSQRKEWTSAVGSYGKYRELKPDAKDSTTVLLALGRAELGAGDLAAAKKVGEQALTQEPEGPRSAAARQLLGETAFASSNFTEAARLFATLAVLFDDPQLTPRAIARAADSFDRSGDAKSAAEWRQKLHDKYPQYQPQPYL